MVLNTTNGMFDVSSVARSAGFALSSPRGSWGSAALHSRAGSPAEHLGWGARLYAVAALRGLRQIQPMNLIRASWSEFVVHPRLVGHGPTLFAGLSKHIDLKLVGRLELGSGAVAMRYEPRR